MADLTTKIASLTLRNPTILASGITGVSCDSLKRTSEGGAGAVTSKSVTMEARKGHNNPIMVAFEGGFLNAVGYSNPGIDHALQEFSSYDGEAPFIFSIVAKDAEEFGEIARKADSLQACAAIEIVLSCPHTPGYGTMAGQGTPQATQDITRAVRQQTKKPLSVKLSPSIQALGDIAKAAESAGANAINMGNTAGPGMVIDIERGQPVLAFKVGGISGPALKPLAVRCVYDVFESVKIPVIGTGGISNGKDALEMMMAGATAVGVGTAVHYRGPQALGEIAREIDAWLDAHGHASPGEIIGIAHENEPRK